MTEISEQARRCADEFFDGRHILRPDVLAAIVQKHLDAQEQGGWIGVEERLPEVRAFRSSLVQIIIEGSHTQVREAYLHVNGWFYVGDPERNLYTLFAQGPKPTGTLIRARKDDFPRVIRWRPLPAPQPGAAGGEK